MPQEIKDAWDDFLTSQNETAKETLVAYYTRLVHSIAYSFYQKRPFILDHTDLVSAGQIGLLQALDRYDPNHLQNASFETYAKRRVYGAILDQINELDWTPRSVRKNIRAVIQAEETGSSMEEIQQKTTMSATEVRTARNNARRTYILPVDQDTIKRMESDHLEEYADERSDVWWSVKNDLDEIESKVIYLRFYIGEGIARTASLLGVSVNNVTVIQKRAIKKLRKILDEN